MLCNRAPSGSRFSTRLSQANYKGVSLLHSSGKSKSKIQNKKHLVFFNKLTKKERKVGPRALS